MGEITFAETRSKSAPTKICTEVEAADTETDPLRADTGSDKEEATGAVAMEAGTERAPSTLGTLSTLGIGHWGKGAPRSLEALIGLNV